jgi:hypothetical protein
MNFFTFSSVWPFHLYDFFTCMAFSPVWLFHLYGFFTCMAFSPVWLFHLYEVFTCMGFSPVWSFHLYEVFICMRFSPVWDFHLYGFCVWILRMDFAYEFSSVDFHLWAFICEFFLRAEYASEALFWWNDHHMNILLQCETSLHYYITSSHVCLRYFYIVVVVFHSNEKIFKAYELFIKISRYTSFDEKNIFSICKSTVEYVSLGLSSSQFFLNLVVARELVFFKTSELLKHNSIRYYTCLIKLFIHEIYCT